MRRIALFAALTLLFGWSYAFGDNQTAFDPEGERIVELVLYDNSLMNEGMVIFPFGDDWVFPLGELSRSLTLNLRLSTRLSLAEGFIGDPTRTFKLNTNECWAEISGQRKPYPCSWVFSYAGDIYAHRMLVQRWIPSRISVNPLRSQVVMDPLFQLPIQARFERERLAARASRSGLVLPDRGYPPFDPGYSLLDGVTAETLLSNRFEITPSKKKFNLSHATQLGGELLGFESIALLSGSLDGWNTPRVSLAKLSGPEEPALFLNLRELRFVDVAMPALPLISNAVTGRGIFASTYPLTRPNNFESTQLQGFLPPGWEVVLYRNDVLIDRQLSDNGRYNFQDVPLFYGRNVFRLTFFGPQGERKDEYRAYNISPELLQPGAGNYRLGVAHLDSGSNRVFAEFGQNFAKYFSFNTGVLHDDRSRRSYAFGSLTGVNELFLFTTSCAIASDGGKACEWGPQSGFMDFTFGGKYTKLFGFRSEKFNDESLSLIQDSQINANISYFFRTVPGINTTFEYVQKNFNIGNTRTLTNRVALGSGQFLFNNELDYTFQGNAPLSGAWQIIYTPDLIRYTMETAYNLRRVNSIAFSAQRNEAYAYNLSATVGFDFTVNKPFVNASGSKLFSDYSVGAFASTNFAGTHSVGVTLGFGGFLDSRSGHLQAARPPLVSTGNALATVFKDLNDNGEWDEGEPLLPKVKMKVGDRVAVGETDENGLLLVRELRPHSPSDLSISLDSLGNDPYLRPSVPGYRVFPRSGKPLRLPMAIRVVGEVDGYVELWEPGAEAAQPLRNVILELLSPDGKVVKEARTDEEGFYTFPEVRPGTYWVRPRADQMNENGLRSEPAAAPVAIEPDGSFVTMEPFRMFPIR